MIKIPGTPINVGGLVVGQQLPAIDFSGIRRWVPNAAEGQPPDHIALLNESGTELTISLPGSARSFTLPAGGWSGGIELEEGDNSIGGIVEFVLPNPPVTLLFAEYYRPGEPVRPPLTLGNSPIGGTSVTTQVVQDGQTVGQQIVESTPTAFHQSVLITTDGVETLSPAIPGSGVSDSYRIRATGDTGPSRWSAGLRSDGFPFIQFSDQTVPNRSRLWGSAGGLNTDVPIAAINGQASAGSFGVPVIVAQALNVPVTVTTAVTIITFTPPAPGLYRVSPWVFMGNNANQLLFLRLTYTEGVSGTQGTVDFACVRNGSLLTTDSSSFPFGSPYAFMPITVYAKSGSFNFALLYQDPGGTPSDTVSVLIERVA